MIGFVALLLAQAGPPPATAVLAPEAVQDFVLDGFKKMKATSKRMKDLSDDQLRAALTDSLSDRSKLIFQPGHGVFVEYTAPDGQLRMWYPNNVDVVKGSWGIRSTKSGVKPCFRYKEAVNPVTNVYEPTECPSAVQTLSEATVLKQWKGDVFSLMSDRIPYKKSNMDMPEPPGAAAPVAE
jgi:hypothetical protein